MTSSNNYTTMRRLNVFIGKIGIMLLFVVLCSSAGRVVKKVTMDDAKTAWEKTLYFAMYKAESKSLSLESYRYLGDIKSEKKRAALLDDIFSDDEFCDCVEITPAQLGELKGLEKNLARNSFLVHGFYKYRHILLARPTEPRKENVAIVGVPGVYSNRERYMASLFGFCNFKKSHRSDFSNANFGYWYAEIYI